MNSTFTKIMQGVGDVIVGAPRSKQIEPEKTFEVTLKDEAGTIDCVIGVETILSKEGYLTVFNGDNSAVKTFAPGTWVSVGAKKDPTG